jgi:hypothetical protein
MAKYHGTRTDIVPELSKHLPPNSNVLYWSLPDPNQPLCQGLFCESIGPLIILPCFWPHLLILGIPFACCAYFAKQSRVKQGVVLTTSTVEVIQMDYDVCCIPGIYIVAGSTRSIPLGSILSLDLNKQNRGCLTSCVPDYTKVHLNDGIVAVGGGTRQGATYGTHLYGHTNIDELREKIMAAKQTYGPNASMMGQAMNVAMMNMMQPGMMQQGMMQPGMMQPGMMQQGMMQPGMMQPGMQQPGMMQPGMQQQGMRY